MTALAPSSAALVMAIVIPRSLNDPVGLRPSTLRNTSQPVNSETRVAGTSGVPPSIRVTTEVFAGTGSRSRYSSTTPRHARAMLTTGPFRQMGGQALEVQADEGTPTRADHVCGGARQRWRARRAVDRAALSSPPSLEPVAGAAYIQRPPSQQMGRRAGDAARFRKHLCRLRKHLCRRAARARPNGHLSRSRRTPPPASRWLPTAPCRDRAAARPYRRGPRPAPRG